MANQNETGVREYTLLIGGAEDGRRMFLDDATHMRGHFVVPVYDPALAPVQPIGQTGHECSTYQTEEYRLEKWVCDNRKFAVAVCVGCSKNVLEELIENYKRGEVAS